MDSEQQKTLLILAAGLGSRYGGNKQTDGLGPGGLPLFSYSIYDAVQAGFTRVVFVIREQDRPAVEGFLAKLRCLPTAEFAVQDLHTALPEGITLPAGREKPLGTAHAILCAAPLLRGPFAVVNADDFYGRSVYAALADALDRGENALAAYPLSATLSPIGTVTRGVCRVEEGRLSAIRETYGIAADCAGRIRDKAGRFLGRNAPVSMNSWGFQVEMLPLLRQAFDAFLASFDGSEKDLTRECALPTAVDGMLRSGKLRVRVDTAGEHWFGVTYREDKPAVREALAALHREGTYPEAL